MSKTNTQFDEIKTESQKLRKFWHQEVDNIFDKIDSMSRSNREENLNALKAYQTKIKKLISEINGTVKQNEELLKTNKISAVNKYKSKLQDYRDFPENFDSQIPTLGSKIDNGKELSIEIGDFRAILKQFPQISRRADVSRTTKTIAELKVKARVVATIPTDYKDLRGVTCIGETEAWIYGNTQTITRIDINATVKDTVITTCQCGPSDIALTREGELIFCGGSRTIGVYSSKTVNIVRHGESETLITTPGGCLPWGLCCTRSGDILVQVCVLLGGLNQIIRYQGQEIKQDIQNDDQRNPIFKNGFNKLFMSENNNGDICVSDTSANTVVVVDTTGRVRFRYNGTPARRKASFAPRGIVTNASSQIIVADYNNNCVHILDQNGQFLRCVDDCGLEKPAGLSVDSGGRLSVGCESGEIKVIDY